MRIGKLDRKITIKFLSKSQNDFGEAVASYGSDFTTWARIDYKITGANENEEDNLIKSVQRVNFLIRYCTNVASITSADRVVYNSQNYDIETVIELGRNTSLKLMCKLLE